MPGPLVSQSPAEAIVAAYREYLLRERGLVEGSLVLRARVARLFLGELSIRSRLRWGSFVPAMSTRLSWRSAVMAAAGRRGHRRW